MSQNIPSVQHSQANSRLLHYQHRSTMFLSNKTVNNEHMLHGMITRRNVEDVGVYGNDEILTPPPQLPR